MPEDPETNPLPSPESPRRSWEAYSLIVAVAIGLLSLGVSAYTAYMLRLQTRAQVYPYLQLVRMPTQHRIAIHNKGTGPAFVRSVVVRIDGKPVTSWKTYFAAVGLKPHGEVAASTIGEAAIAANETLPMLIFRDADDFDAYAAIDPARSSASICYCSVLDECWTLHLAPDAPGAPQPIGMCRADPATAFTD